MSSRILCRVYPLVILFVLPLRLSADDKEKTLGSEFIDMPDSYYQKKQDEAAAKQAEKGDVKETPGYLPGYLKTPGVGLSPHAPQFSPSLPSTLTPPFGAPTRDRAMKFEFHGYIQAALRAGIGKRDDPTDDQSKATLHADPVVPGGAYGWFDHSNTVPTPWAQLNFSYGNDLVKTTAILGAWSAGRVDDASGNYMGHAQKIFSDVYLTYAPNLGPVSLKFNAGAFPDRYGFMSKWHQGAYGASLIGDIYGLGVTGTLELQFEGDFDILAEGGFKGELDKAPLGQPLDGASEYARSEEGSTWAGHAHVGVRFAKRFNPTFHFIQSWSQDDRKDLANDPNTPVNESKTRKDGLLRILGGDLRIDGERFGFLYLGASHVVGEHANSLTNLVQVINTGSGREFNERFWGYASDGSGTLTLAGAQYSLSLGTLLRHPMEYWGEGPDLTISLFGIYGHSASEAEEIGDRDMLKYGVEGVYSIAKHVAASMRFDHVMPDLDASGRSFGVISPKLIIRSDWNTRESLTLQYAYYALGDDVMVRGDNRLMNVNSDNPDRHMVCIYGTIWW